MLNLFFLVMVFIGLVLMIHYVNNEKRNRIAVIFTGIMTLGFVISVIALPKVMPYHFESDSMYFSEVQSPSKNTVRLITAHGIKDFRKDDVSFGFTKGESSVTIKTPVYDCDILNVLLDAPCETIVLADQHLDGE